MRERERRETGREREREKEKESERGRGSEKKEEARESARARKTERARERAREKGKGRGAVRPSPHGGLQSTRDPRNRVRGSCSTKICTRRCLQGKATFLALKTFLWCIFMGQVDFYNDSAVHRVVSS